MHKCDFSVLHWKYPFFSNLVKKNQNCQCKLVFGAQTNLNMQNLVVMYTVSFIEQKQLFWSKICRNNLNMQNSILVFTFSILNQKHPFRETRLNKEQLWSMQLYGSTDFKIESCGQHGFFILLQSKYLRKNFFFN